MKKFFVLSLILVTFSALSAQPVSAVSAPQGVLMGYDLNHFEGLKSVGDLPRDLQLSLDELYALDKQRVRDYNDGKMANRDKVLTSSYHINNLMASGRILYGDPITRMVERIADTLLHDYPALRKELRFYTVKSPEVNAFATGQGMIFVNVGLVAQLENEAQLAFILSHEIIHYYRQHALEELTRTQKNDRSGDWENRQLNEFLRYHQRSREMENEADSLGLLMFYMGSPYGKQVTDGVFDVLQYAYLPFDELPFDTTYFNSPYYKLSGSGLFLDEVAPITARDDYDDSRSTHPNLLKRREQTADILAGMHGGSDFVTVTPAEFVELQTLARFECIRQNLIYADYVRAFYDSYLLSRLYPDNYFLTTARAQSVYAMAKSQIFTNTKHLAGDSLRVEGEIQQLYHLFSSMPNEDMAIVALREAWKGHLLFPDDKRLSAMSEDMATVLLSKCNFMRTSFASAMDTTPVVVDTAVSARNQKYDRIKQKRNRQNRSNYRHYAFVDFLQQDGSFDALLRRATESLSRPADESSKQRALQGMSMISYAPDYLVIDEKEKEVLVQKSDRQEQRMPQLVKSAVRTAGVSVIDFSPSRMRTSSGEKDYNDYMTLKEWCMEYWQSKGNYYLSLFMQPEMDAMLKQYDADLLGVTIVVNVENVTKPYTGFYLLFSTVVAPALPVGVYNCVAGHESTVVYSLFVDPHTGETLAKRITTVDSKDSDALIQSSIYANLSKIKK